MELVEGQTLADRIAQGPLPLDEALPIARQIAEALEYAHEKGIIHRDLKPANVKITPEGVVRFWTSGWPKPWKTVRRGSGELADADGASDGNRGDSGDGSLHGSGAGAGKAVDRRADIWAFGVVFYEMLTGKRLFGGETVATRWRRC